MKKTAVFIVLLSVIGLINSCDSIDVNEGEEAPPKEVKADEQYIMQGKILAQTAANALMGQLSNKLNVGGPEKAIKYCNLKAIPILDSLSFLYKARIARKSLKFRNPSNQPDHLETSILESYQNNLNNGQPIAATARVVDSTETRFFAPIIVQPFCLSCHGSTDAEIGKKQLALIDSLYPSDKARNYKAGDLRGIWSIRFEL